MEIMPHGGHNLFTVHEVGEVAMNNNLVKVGLLVGALAYTPVLSSAEQKYDDFGQCIEDSKIVAVDEKRTYDEIVVSHNISTDAKKKIKDEKGQSQDVTPLYGVKVRKLRIRGSSRSSDGVTKLEGKSFDGMEGLEEIEFCNGIPEFSEDRWFPDGGWLKSFRKLTLTNINSFLYQKNRETDCSLNRLFFLRGVKVIEFSADNKNKDALRRLCKSGLQGKLLEGCGSIEGLIIPSDLAVDPGIDWAGIIKHSALKKKEVKSLPTIEAKDIVLMNVSRDGKITDDVTFIRPDSIGDDVNKIYLPFGLKEFDWERVVNLHRQYLLKKDSVLFYPNIMDNSDNGDKCRVENSVGPIRSVCVRITTAYSGLSIIDVNHCVTNFVSDARGNIWESEIGLTRGLLGEECDLHFAINVRNKGQTSVLPVDIALSDNQTCSSICVRFKYPAWGWLKILCLIGMGVLGCMLSVMLVRHYSHVVNAGEEKRCLVLSVVLVTVGVILVVLGLKNVCVLQYVVDRWLTGPVMGYLNASLISSLVISVTTSLVQMGIGVLQGIEVAPFGLGINFQDMLAPVQRILERIGSFSWLATATLTLLRICCQILRDYATYLWAVSGVSMAMVGGINFVSTIKREEYGLGLKRLAAKIACVSAFLVLGLPFVLFLCSCVSGDMMTRAGNSFDNALTGFKVLADSFSFSGLMSLSAIQALLSQFTNAVAQLMSAAMSYLATKAFDCFLVPLALYFSFRIVLRFCSDRKDEELARIRKLLAEGSKQKISRPSPRQEQSFDRESRDNDAIRVEYKNDSGNLTSRCNMYGRIKPEWITAGCAIAILIALLVVLLGGNSGQPSAAVATAGSGGSSSGTVPVVAGMLFGISTLGWLLILLFVIVDSWVCWKAACVVRRVRNSDKDPAQKLALLKEDDFYFDLPLYLGLFGTVLGFLFLSGQSESQSGRVIAYFSTVFGILVSVLIHAGVSQYKSVCLGVKTEKEVLALRIMKVGVKFVRFMDRLAARFGKFKIKGTGK